jgi:VanZ family protein
VTDAINRPQFDTYRDVATALYIITAFTLGTLPLYNRFWWYDIAMHFTIGIAVTIVVVAVTGVTTLTAIMLYNIAILWEIFEYATQVFLISYRDTLTDLLVTSVGFICGLALWMHLHHDVSASRD